MSRRSLALHRSTIATGALAAAALILATPAPLAAQQPDTAGARAAPQVISPEAGRRRAEAAGTTIPGERPAGPLRWDPDSVPELADLLSAREMEEAGLAKLSAEEQAALARVLVRRRAIGRMGMTMAPRAWAVPLRRSLVSPVPVELVTDLDPRSAVPIVDLAAGGTLIILGDGTIWEVYLPDRPTTDAWAPGESVLVRRAPAGVNGYDYELINGGEADGVLARFRGRSDAR